MQIIHFDEDEGELEISGTFGEPDEPSVSSLFSSAAPSDPTKFARIRVDADGSWVVVQPTS